MIRLELSPLGAVVLGAGLVVLSMFSACLAAWWVDRKHRGDASAPTTATQDSAASLDADWMRSQVHALLRSQAQLHDQMNQQRASLARICDQLDQAPPRILAPAPDAQGEATQRPKQDASVAPAPSASRAALSAVPAGTPAPSPVSARSPMGDAPMPMPRPRSEPAVTAEEPERELSDEEIDALPPELPAAANQRKRILAPPKKPTLRNL